MPPTALRRPVTVAVSLLVCTAGLALSPLLLAFGVLTQALTGRRQPLIVARLTLAYFSHELAALLMCGALWVAAGAGRLIGTRRVQLLHWRLLGWFIGGLAAAGRKALEIDVDTELSSDAGRALEADRPVIVLSRHAGPGDTIFIVDQLMSRFRRRPSVVFKQSIAIDPCVDILSHRLPQAMIDPADREGAKARIEQVLAQLGARGALLLFPEGGNFTDERRRSALDRLRRKGRRRSAARAEGMPHRAAAAARGGAGRARRAERVGRRVRRPHRSRPGCLPGPVLARYAGGPDAPGPNVAGALRTGAHHRR